MIKNFDDSFCFLYPLLLTKHPYYQTRLKYKIKCGKKVEFGTKRWF